MPGVFAAVGVGLVTWWAVGNRDTGEDYLIGPFNLPSWVEPTVDMVGVVLLVLAVAAMKVTGLRRGALLATSTVVLLSLDAAFVGAAWRVLTAGAVGANIGGALLALAGPVLFSLLLASGALIEVRRRGGSASKLAMLPVLAALVGPGFQVLLWLAAG